MARAIERPTRNEAMIVPNAATVTTTPMAIAIPSGQPNPGVSSQERTDQTKKMPARTATTANGTAVNANLAGTLICRNG